MSSDEKVRTGKKRRARMNNSLADIIGWNGDKSDLYREIGRFVFEYSQLEAELRRIFRKKVSIDLEHNDIMTAAFDFAKLVTAILAASAIEEDRQDGKPDPVLEKLLKACHKVNEARVAVVHGRWSSTYGGDRVYQVARGSMKQQKMFEYEGDLDEHSDAVDKLRIDIVEAVRAGDERRGPLKKKRILRKKKV
jgi:hypothetical protein